MTDFVRYWSWRLGRKIYCWARGDLQNDPSRNGEYWLLEKAINDSDMQLVLFDVGANKGDWSVRALSLAKKFDKQPTLFAFEPCGETRAILKGRLPAGLNVIVSPCALAEAEGEASFYSSGAGSGTNSLNAISGDAVEQVRMTTFDAYIKEHQLERVSMLKIDTEGFDLAVLQGAATALANGKIDLIQFEYNWRWLLNKASLRDVFQLIKGKPYRLGKLVGESMVLFDEWHFELDRFFENNYVLVLKGSAMENRGQSIMFDASNVAVQRRVVS